MKKAFWNYIHEEVDLRVWVRRGVFVDVRDDGTRMSPRNNDHARPNFGWVVMCPEDDLSHDCIL